MTVLIVHTSQVSYTASIKVIMFFTTEDQNAVKKSLKQAKKAAQAREDSKCLLIWVIEFK